MATTLEIDVMKLKDVLSSLWDVQLDEVYLIILQFILEASPRLLYQHGICQVMIKNKNSIKKALFQHLPLSILTNKLYIKPIVNLISSYACEPHSKLCGQLRQPDLKTCRNHIQYHNEVSSSTLSMDKLQSWWNKHFEEAKEPRNPVELIVMGYKYLVDMKIRPRSAMNFIVNHDTKSIDICPCPYPLQSNPPRLWNKSELNYRFCWSHHNFTTCKRSRLLFRLLFPAEVTIQYQYIF